MSLQPLIRKLSSRLSDLLAGFPRLHSAFRKLFLELPVAWRGPVIVHDRLQALAGCQDEVFFIQIGANDGEQNDPLRHFVEKCNWTGILVEPVPEYFDTLKRNYSGREGLHFENVAISDSDEVRELWYLEDLKGRLPEWARGLGSFFKDEVTSVDLPGLNLDEFLRKIDVPCLSFNKLLEKHRHPVVDLLIIDVQGFDGKIVQQIDFTLVQPKVIVFEHNLLEQVEKEQCRKLLESRGYRLVEDHWDTVASLEG